MKLRNMINAIAKRRAEPEIKRWAEIEYGEDAKFALEQYRATGVFPGKG